MRHIISQRFTRQRTGEIVLTVTTDDGDLITYTMSMPMLAAINHARRSRQSELERYAPDGVFEPRLR